MNKYVKQTKVLEAFIYDGDFVDCDGNAYVPSWVFEAIEQGVLYYDNNGDLFFKTLEDDILINVGDYIVKGVSEEIFPCTTDAFDLAISNFRIIASSWRKQKC